MNADNTHNIFILLLVAVITGFVVPAFLKSFEIIFSRQVEKRTEIRNKQLELIEQLTKTIWEWRFLGKQVCYYGCDYKKSKPEEERFREAIGAYNKRVWELFTEIKALKSRSIVWFPESAPAEIEALYDYIKTEIDSPLTELMNESVDNNKDFSKKFFKWQERFSDEVSPQIEKHITAIATTINKPKA
jgi:hypothetical protein